MKKRFFVLGLFSIIFVGTLGWNWINPLGSPSIQKVEIGSKPSQERQADLTLSKSLEKSLKAETTQKVNLLKEILESKNDNDARLDSEFSNLEPEVLKALENEYHKLPAENRND